MRNFLGGFGRWAAAAVGAAWLGCAAPQDEPIETLFCAPDPGSCQARVLAIIDEAHTTLQCAVFSFTLLDVAQALVSAHERGVAVWVVVESTQVDDEVVDLLEQSGVFVRLDGNARSMHHKFVVADQRVVATGSFNWTFFADTQNDENLMVFDSRDLAADFGAEFERVWNEAGP